MQFWHEQFLPLGSGTRAKAIGLRHGLGNVVVVLLFTASWFMRKPLPSQPSMGALTLSFIALALALVTGWLGGELVDRLGVGVDHGAHLNSPKFIVGTTSGRINHKARDKQGGVTA